jgi:aldose 1-epimerase
MRVYLPTGKILSHDDTSKKIADGEFVSNVPTSRHYKTKNKGEVVLYDETANVSLVYENDEKYKFRLVYNGDATEFICIEPQTSMANAPNSPFDREYAGFSYIESGKTQTYKSKIYLTEGNKI